MQQAIYEAFVSIGWWEILVTMCNTLITFAIIKKFLFKPVRKMLAQREEEVKTIYSAAEQAQTEAEQKRTEYTERLSKAKEEAAEIVGSATRRATVRSEEINLRKTELKALQAQINPHFLYNTLDSISWMCEQGKNAEAVVMVNALARLFRISISKGHELIPIRSEVQHAQSYLQIQSVRYKEQFSYHFDVEEDCTEYLCNKITLQPIIENAIYHGVNGLVDEGHIEIRVRADGEDVLFTVEDNGVGMEPEQIEEIFRRKPDGKSGIGIKNVNDRLKIWFGDAYGITIESVPDEGTKVTVRMPKVREEAEHEKH